MKKTILRIILTLLMIILITGCSKTFEVNAIDETINYEDKMFSVASGYGYSREDAYSLIESIEYDAANVLDEYDDFVRINWLYNDIPHDIVCPPSVVQANHIDTSLLEYHEVDEKYLSLLNSAKEKLIKYIDDSDVLRDKETLKEQVLAIELYVCTDTMNTGIFGEGLAFVFYDGAVYLDSRNADAEWLSEFVLVHELFHGLRYFTSNSESEVYKPRYTYHLFEEAFVNILAESCNPAISLPKNVRYEEFSYMPAHPYVYSYLYFFGEDALEAFFYGYDEFFEKNGGDSFKAEHDALSAVLMYFGEYPDVPEIYYEILNKMIQ